MSWTRVREVYSTVNKRVTIFDVEDDLKQDKVLKQIRKDSTRELGELLFDPNTFNGQTEQLLMSHYQLDEESLKDYAKLVSAIRLEINQRVSAHLREKEEEIGEANEESQDREQVRQPSDLKPRREDFSEVFNPCHPSRRRKSLRQLDAETRLRLVKLVASKSRTCGEIATLFNVKVKAVYELVKDLKKKKVLFINKRKSELRKATEEAGVICAIHKASIDQRHVWSARQV